MDVRARPKSNYLQTANWEQLYTLTNHWKSDTEFYKVEIQFLKDLINKYFIWLIEDEDINTIRDMTVKLGLTERECQSLDDGIDKHLKHIGGLIENKFAHEEQSFREEHILLEDKLAAFIQDFRQLRKDIFKTTRNVMEEEKLKRQLSK